MLSDVAHELGIYCPLKAIYCSYISVYRDYSKRYYLGGKVLWSAYKNERSGIHPVPHAFILSDLFMTCANSMKEKHKSPVNQ